MSILIQGMAMPNRCFECIFLTTVPNFFCLAGKRDLCAEHGINISRPNWCPLIEVPPHGRLIDADELKKKVLTWLPSDPCGQEEKEFPFETDICVSMLMEIEEAESIIEAED